MGPSRTPTIPLPRTWAADAAPIGLVVLRRDGVILYANAGARDLLGASADQDLVGMDAREFHAVPDVALANVRDHLAGGDLRNLELVLRRLDGAAVTVLIHARILPEGPGGATVVASLEDVGQRRASQEQALRQRTMSAVGRLAGGMAHHFNNLLGSILANTSLLAEAIAADDPSREEVADIAAAARRASEISDLLLMVSGREVVARGELDLASWLYGAAGTVRSGIAEDVEVVVQAGRGPLTVSMDGDRLLQALHHLVKNAEEALAGGGRILLDVREVELAGAADEPAFVPPAPPGRYACLQVADDGLGMNQETLGRVLEPFFSTKRDREGAGLGLALVYGIVAQAGGHLSVESAPVVGTRVRILLPLDRRPEHEGADTEMPLLVDGWEEPRVPAGPPAPAGNGSGTQQDGEQSLVVVADDEDTVRTVMEKLLKRSGYRVMTAVNGRDAQRLLQEHGHQATLLVSDVMMPELNGVELAYWTRGKIPGLPILLVSGFVDAPLIQKWIAEEPESFLAKPFEPDEFLERVRQAVAASEG